MRIGNLRYRITIQQLTLLADGAGGSIDSWTDLATVWANIKAKPGGTESEVGGVMSSQARYLVTIRKRTDVKPEMRIVWGARTLGITSAMQDGPDALLLECEELGDGGEL